MTPTDQDCENCGRPATYAWTFEDGSRVTTCEKCNPGGGKRRHLLACTRPGATDDPPPSSGPLTIAQAAKRENVSTRTVYRWLVQGELEGGAHRTSDAGQWRIEPDALDKRRARGPRPQPRRAAGAVRASSSRGAPADDGVVWPE